MLSNVIPIDRARPEQCLKSAILEATNFWVFRMVRQHPGQQHLLSLVEGGERRRVAVKHLQRQAAAIQIGQGFNSITILNRMKTGSIIQAILIFIQRRFMANVPAGGG